MDITINSIELDGKKYKIIRGNQATCPNCAFYKRAACPNIDFTLICCLLENKDGNIIFQGVKRCRRETKIK